MTSAFPRFRRLASIRHRLERDYARFGREREGRNGDLWVEKVLENYEFHVKRAYENASEDEIRGLFEDIGEVVGVRAGLVEEFYSHFRLEMKPVCEVYIRPMVLKLDIGSIIEREVNTAFEDKGQFLPIGESTFGAEESTEETKSQTGSVDASMTTYWVAVGTDTEKQPCASCLHTDCTLLFTSQSSPRLILTCLAPTHWSLFSLNPIPADILVLEVTGEVIGQTEHYASITYFDCLLSISPPLYLRCREKGSLARFLTHSCEPNLSVLRLTPDTDYLQTRLLLFSNRPIRREEELTVDFDQLYSLRIHIPCKCGASRCKGEIGTPSLPIE